MKFYHLLPVLLLAIGLHAQNNAPQISITNVQTDTVVKTITITYDAFDADNDLLEITPYLSVDSGYAHVAPILAASGDVGFPVSPGNNLSLVVSYDLNSLGNASGQNNQAFVGVKLVASDLKPISVDNILQGIDSASVYNDMLFIAQPRHHVGNPAGLELIKDSLQTRFNRYGLQNERFGFNMGAVASENILGRQAGNAQEEQVIVVDGHFDAVQGVPGADDNGSAIAGVLAAARILSNYHFQKSINYLGFDKEEQGLLGSANYINNSIKPFENIEAVLNMEMIGFYSNTPNSQQIPFGFSQLFPASVDSINDSGNRGVFLFVVGNTASAALSATFDSVARAHVPGIRSLVLNVPGNGQIAQDLRRSDHASFWDAGYQALMLTDGADFRNANYHTPGDSLGTLDIPFLVRNIKAMVATAAVLAKPISADEDQAIAGQLLSNVAFSVPENLLKTNIELYPNPATGQVKVRFGENLPNAIITVIDAAGKVVLTKQENISSDQPVVLDIKQSGVFVLKVQHGQQQTSRRFIISEGHQH